VKRISSPVRARVLSVRTEAGRAPFAVAIPLDEGLKRMYGRITFTLRPPVWQESCLPDGGNVVVLSDIRQKVTLVKNNGIHEKTMWRAYRACFYREAKRSPLP
jgi:hypothetical protein